VWAPAGFPVGGLAEMKSSVGAWLGIPQQAPTSPCRRHPTGWPDAGGAADAGIAAAGAARELGRPSQGCSTTLPCTARRGAARSSQQATSAPAYAGACGSAGGSIWANGACDLCAWSSS
jgi:hypothetical protein